eukprot:6573928-Alexandrium_andersonii.AAC.1
MRRAACGVLLAARGSPRTAYHPRPARRGVQLRVRSSQLVARSSPPTACCPQFAAWLLALQVADGGVHRV